MAKNKIINAPFQFKTNYQDEPKVGDKVMYFGENERVRGRTGIVIREGYNRREYTFVRFEGSISCSVKINELIKIELV